MVKFEKYFMNSMTMQERIVYVKKYQNLVNSDDDKQFNSLMSKTLKAVYNYEQCYGVSGMVDTNKIADIVHLLVFHIYEDMANRYMETVPQISSNI